MYLQLFSPFSLDPSRFSSRQALSIAKFSPNLELPKPQRSLLDLDEMLDKAQTGKLHF